MIMSAGSLSHYRASLSVRFESLRDLDVCLCARRTVLTTKLLQPVFFFFAKPTACLLCEGNRVNFELPVLMYALARREH